MKMKKTLSKSENTEPSKVGVIDYMIIRLKEKVQVITRTSINTY